MNVTVTPAVFSTQPVGGPADQPLPGQPVVTIVGSNGYARPVPLSLKSGTGTPGAVVSGASANAVNGAAIFTSWWRSHRGERMPVTVT